MLPTKNKFDEYVKIGLLRCQTDKNRPLTIYNYTELTQFDRLWNTVTRNARGVVFDEKGRCVIRCLPKFFNADEPNSILERPQDESFKICEKLDGSLIQVVNDAQYGLIVTSKGSFISDHANWAKEILADIDKNVFKEGITYVFELIHPANRIVVDYFNEKKLVFLSSIDNKTGKEYDFSWPHKPQEYNLYDIGNIMTQPNFEGVVYVYESGYRVKVKTEEYVRLHRIMTGYSAKTIWESLKDDKPLDLKNMPEEFMQWFNDTKNSLMVEYVKIEKEAHEWAKKIPPMATGKEIAETIEPFIHKSVVWNILKNKDYSSYIWKVLKPKGNSNPFENR